MSETRSNVLLITVDCLRYDRCGFAGHHRDTTPTLDALAAESTVFDNAFATGPYTTESFPGILAGLHSHNGAYLGTDPAWKVIPSEHDTVATHFSDAGYHTTATISNPHLSADRNFNRGFDQFENLRLADRTDRALGGDDPTESGLSDRVRRGIETLRDSVTDTAGVTFLGRLYQYRFNWPTIRGSAVVDSLFETLDVDERPFFAWTHLMDLHRPINPVAGNQDGIEPDYSLIEQLRIDANIAADECDARFEAVYDNALRHVDSHVKRILGWLRRQGLWEDTCIVVTGDHGEALYDRGRYGHPRHYLYDELLRVPLLIKPPDGSATRISRPFSLSWLGELIGDAVDLPRPSFPAASGRGDHLSDDGPSGNFVVSDVIDEHGHSIAVRDTDDKYVTNSLTETADRGVVYTPDAAGYRILMEPNERRPRDPETVPSEMRDVAESITTAPDDLPRARGGFTDEMKERLEKLGYRMG